MQEQKSQLDASTASAKKLIDKSENNGVPSDQNSKISTQNATNVERNSRKTGGANDIIKELEDYVKDKKTNTNKYLDDISEFDTSQYK